MRGHLQMASGGLLLSHEAGEGALSLFHLKMLLHLTGKQDILQSAFAARRSTHLCATDAQRRKEEERGLPPCPRLLPPTPRRKVRRTRLLAYCTRAGPLSVLSLPSSLPCALPTPAVSSPALPEPIRDWV